MPWNLTDVKLLMSKLVQVMARWHQATGPYLHCHTASLGHKELTSIVLRNPMESYWSFQMMPSDHKNAGNYQNSVYNCSRRYICFSTSFHVQCSWFSNTGIYFELLCHIVDHIHMVCKTVYCIISMSLFLFMSDNRCSPRICLNRMHLIVFILCISSPHLISFFI